MRANEIITESKVWWRGVSTAEADAIRNSNGTILPNKSNVPLWNDNEISEYVGITDEDAEYYNKLDAGINLTDDEENAEGYGTGLLWIDSSLVEYEFGPYAFVELSRLTGYGKYWGVK